MAERCRLPACSAWATQGGKGTAQIKGGTLNLSQWDDYASIQGASVLDVSGTGKVVINGDHQHVGERLCQHRPDHEQWRSGHVVVDYNNINVGKTTIYPSGLYLPPAQVTWNPAPIPSSNGLWNESANWTGGVCPGNVTVVTFNVPDAIPCTVTNAAVARVCAHGQQRRSRRHTDHYQRRQPDCTGADDWNCRRLTATPD